MWLTIGNIALVAFLALAIALLVMVYMRNSRRKGLPRWESSSHLDQIRGAMPPMPTPKPTRRSRRSDDDGPPPRH
ncbi:MAG: hypothetical protein QOI25_4247 [Mycobacterium sp.]|jgi:hypothetical protein|nr:hypothetical protein [Mycobacterium sp.]